MTGHLEVGKSSLIGVLTHGEMDNGRGRARLDLFRHMHEIQSGRTSSISQEILGFDRGGSVSLAYLPTVQFFAGRPAFHSSIQLNFQECPAFLCIILFYCVPPCPAKFNASSRSYHGSGSHVWSC